MLHLVWFLLAPAATLIVALLSALARRARRTSSLPPLPPGRKPSPPSRYQHALDQQELDLLLDEMDHSAPRRSFSILSLR
ncbi:MAG TPA: hypothetical protein VGB94_02885, partial [Acidobacteriaceae bacterium]